MELKLESLTLQTMLIVRMHLHLESHLHIVLQTRQQKLGLNGSPVAILGEQSRQVIMNPLSLCQISLGVQQMGFGRSQLLTIGLQMTEHYLVLV